MGLSSSTLLDENKSNFIRGRAQAELKNFASFYKKQYSLAYLSHVHDELVQRKQEHTQLLKQRDPPEAAEVFYEDNVLHFDDNRKWKERYAVVRANYCLECHESYDSYINGSKPLYKLLPTGGTVLTTEEKYMEMVDKCFPDTNNVKEDFAPPAAEIPGDFPVYLKLPYRRDYYFCFYEEDKQTEFISALSDCIRHQNQDFLKKKTCDVQAFVKAMQLYRQERGQYEMWDMLIGSDVRVLANLTMEDLLPNLVKDLLPRLKARKTEKKRIWFATVEAAYYLVQETMMEGMTALKEECIENAKKQSACMRSDMDQIMTSRAFLERKVRGRVEEPVTKYCKENVEPHLSAVLEEVMGPISMGFKEARELSEAMMDQLCQDYQEGLTKELLQLALVKMSKPDLQTCYEKVSGLKDHIQELQQTFSYTNCKGLEHSTQIYIQQLVENVAYTFDHFLQKAEKEQKDLADSMVKAKHRVLKQYDYDSSTVRKKIFQEALINITLPSVKSHFAPTFKKELPEFEQYIFADYAPFIKVENVYDDILQKILETEVSKVVKEAANMKKYNLFTESRYNFSVSSIHSTTPGSIPGSPPHTSSSLTQYQAKPASPLALHSSGETVPHELAQETAGAQAGGQHRTEEKGVLEMLLRAKSGTKISPTKPENHIVHPMAVEKAAEAIPPSTESLKEGEHDKVVVKLTPLTTGTSVDALVNTESTLITGQTPQAVALKAVELVANGTAIQSSPSKEDAQLLDQMVQKNESPTGSIKKSAPHVIVMPSAREYNMPESKLLQDLVPSDGASCVTEDEVVVESNEEDVPTTEINVGVVRPQKLDEMLIVKCEDITDAEACMEATAAHENFPHCKEDKSPEANNLKNTEQSEGEDWGCVFFPGAECPSNDPTVAEPVVRPLDCIKEIRDLVVEVIEIEEIVQQHPDDGVV
ncbi:protein Niban 1a [Hoplias malabaricus]|uniref:protein Niban 1a n=1 Tax=Hoplias malabaricus TaxID=27720 RepID=UPI0034632182